MLPFVSPMLLSGERKQVDQWVGFTSTADAGYTTINWETVTKPSWANSALIECYSAGEGVSATDEGGGDYYWFSGSGGGYCSIDVSLIGVTEVQIKRPRITWPMGSGVFSNGDFTTMVTAKKNAAGVRLNGSSIVCYALGASSGANGGGDTGGTSTPQDDGTSNAALNFSVGTVRNRGGFGVMSSGGLNTLSDAGGGGGAGPSGGGAAGSYTAGGAAGGGLAGAGGFNAAGNRPLLDGNLYNGGAGMSNENDVYGMPGRGLVQITWRQG